jgi:peptide/nickel transport system ATP-binding protein
MTLLSVDNLTITRAKSGAPVLRDATISVAPGETVGVAGESGCGKSTLLLALMAIVKPGLSIASGKILLQGLDLTGSDPETLRRMRGPVVAMVPQSATLALTPTMRIGAQLSEAMAVHNEVPPADIANRITSLLARVRLPDPDRISRRYPHELSGGQMQRVAIAMAIACRPRLLLLDEPTTGLDATTQAGILDLLDELRRKTGMAMVCVSHDIGVLARLSDRIAVMYAGRIVEDRPAPALVERPAHPYTRALLSSVPRLDAPGIPPAIPGRPPSPDNIESGCAFAPRCDLVQDVCRSQPLFAPLDDDGHVACHLPDLSLPARALPAQADASMATGAPLLVVEGLTVHYSRKPLFARRPPPPPVVSDVSFCLARGEILGLVGQSGSGKSTILRALAGLWPRSAGEVTIDGLALASDTNHRPRDALRRIQVVFQNPDASLNPRHSVREILAQPLRLYFGADAATVENRARALLDDVRLDPAYLDRRPAQLSGGERQRVALARAFAARPEVILCDEVTSALDVSVQASVLALIRNLCQAQGTACLFVAHDIAVVAALCDRVAVLNLGHIVEIGPTRTVCTMPRADCTRALIASAMGHVPPATNSTGAFSLQA